MTKRQAVLLIGIAFGLGIALAWSESRAQQPQNGVPCRYVPNGSNITIACANGYWVTTTPDGETFTGMGMSDPSAQAQGSGIVINPATGGIDLTQGRTVTPPTQVLPQLAPYQAEAYGFQPRQD
jgi:hypothetical protein